MIRQIIVEAIMTVVVEVVEVDPTDTVTNHPMTNLPQEAEDIEIGMMMFIIGRLLHQVES